jgi:hypothetical protein
MKVNDFIVQYPHTLADCARYIDGLMDGCAIGGVSGDDVVMDVMLSHGDHELTGSDTAHNFGIVRWLCRRRFLEVVRADRFGGAVDDNTPAAGVSVSDGLRHWGALADLLKDAPATQLQILIMYCDGLALVDCARVLGVPFGVVRGRFRRAVLRLRKRCNARCIDAEALAGLLVV